MWEYIANNGFIVPFQMFILSLIPIQFLYFINIIITASLPGILYGIALRGDFGKGFSIMVSSFPYYVFEVFALCLFAAILFTCNQVVRVKIKSMFKKSKYKKSFIKSLFDTVKTL